jgi:hypothetical protein
MSSVQGANGSASAIQQWQYLQSLLSTGSAGSGKKASGGDQAATAFDPFAGLGGGEASSAGTGAPRPPISLGTMSALIDAQAQASTGGGLSQFQQKVFGKLDGDSDGSVTKAELEKAFGTDNQAASDYVMKKLDTDGDGAVSQSEFAAGTTRSAHHHHHAGPPPEQTGQSANAKDPLSQLLQAAGASSTSTSNSDGSSTTTITYADGSKISMTTAASSNTDNSTNSGTSNSARSNLLEQLIKLQAQLTNSTTATSSPTA